MTPPVLFFGLFQLVVAGGTLAAVVAPGSRFARAWPAGAQELPARIALALAASYGIMGVYCLAFGLLPVTSWPGYRPDGSITFIVVFLAGLLLLAIPRVIVTLILRRKA